MPSQLSPAREAARSTTTSSLRPAEERSCPSTRPGPARFDIVAFESLAIETTTFCVSDPILLWTLMWREGVELSASVASDGGRVRGGMRGDSEAGRT
jgi:hypothetical protein